MFFIDVILPIPLNQLFTYSVNKDEAAFLKQGMRVAVPFGRSKIYTAVVFQVHQQAPVGYEVKSIDHILDEYPVINEHQIKLWQWMSDYYMCSMGDLLRAALPNSFLLESQTLVKVTEDFDFPSDSKTLTEDQQLILEVLQQQTSIHIDGVKKIVGKKDVMPAIKTLIDLGYVALEETIFEKYVPKLVKYLRLHPQYEGGMALQQLLLTLDRAYKQKELLMTFFTLQSRSKKPIATEDLKKESDASTSVLKALIDKNILEEYVIKEDRMVQEVASEEVKILSAAQQQALEEIESAFIEKDVVLLHGVTSSGKTEVYVSLIEKMLASGKQILYMLPEIALTTQLIRRLEKYFGERISVYHSKFSINERTEVWNNVLHKKPKAQIIVGARSALFLPFSDLQLIIVDEEHEASFKQYNPAPRYQARDCAIVLAALHKSKVLLGSATPSIESYYNAKTEKYGLVELVTRFGDVHMPDIQLIDIKDRSKRKQMDGYFSKDLLTAMHEVLEQNEQIILFQNRRGFSPVLECTACGVSPQCPNCDVSLTYHKNKRQLRCHYCNYHMPMMSACMACGSVSLDTKGFGTEQVELALNTLFPEKRIARMDQDTTRGKHAYSKLIDALENQEIDILVGTQMLAKGLDFRNIGLVGVMNADNLLYFPDFRAHERSYQLLSQVAGRAGRTEKRGKVLVQTYNPLHPILKQVQNTDYKGMAKDQLKERQEFFYPPFYRLIRIEFKDRHLQKVEQGAQWFSAALQKQFGDLVLGPVQPPVGRIRNLYINNTLLKIPKNLSLEKTKSYISRIQNRFLTFKEFASIRITIDVDPY